MVASNYIYIRVFVAVNIKPMTAWGLASVIGILVLGTVVLIFVIQKR